MFIAPQCSDVAIKPKSIIEVVSGRRMCNALQSLAKARYFMSTCNSIILIKLKKITNNRSECFTWLILFFEHGFVLRPA